ncbi:MAG TPA: amino acid adenylation domain-containing protein, partial [Blastocatellia bacterium]|nr:amino acid adenylation domain-containing protein [Blastocatellia bacterium]
GAGGGGVSPAQLRQALKERLPEYMVPAAVVAVAGLPLTANGKVDRRRLLEEEWRGVGEGEVAEARTAVEELLVGVWGEVLGVEVSGVGDSFFELGGHSLLATQVISRLRDLFNITLPVRTLFESPTITEFAEHIESALHKTAGADSLPMVPVSREMDLPLSFAQQRLWFLNQFEPDNPFCNISGAIHISGPLDTDSLEHSINAIIKRHEALRTVFSTKDGRPVQVIAPSLVLHIEVTDLQKLTEPERLAEVERLAITEETTPFDLEQGPLVRARVLRLSEQEHILLLSLHHIIADGWSLGIFLHELAIYYEAFMVGRSASLPELPVQYADFAHWQREWLQGEVLESQLGYWKEALAGAPVILELPGDRPRPTIQTYRGATQSHVIPKHLAEQLKALSRQQGATLYMTLLAGFSTLLYRYTGQQDILIGSGIANRTRSEVEGIMGCFVNTLAVRSNMADDPKLIELLTRERETLLGAYAHQDLPFERLVEEMQPERDLSREPLCQVVFTFNNQPRPKMELGGLRLRFLEDRSQSAKVDLTLEIEDSQRGLEGLIQFNTDLFDAATIARMWQHLHTLFESIVADPQQRLSRLALLTEAERRQLVSEWNQTQAAYEQDASVCEMFERQACLAPDELAVISDGQATTYAELNAGANQLARYLRKMGVGPEVLVGICVERGIEMIVGLLGVLKAGGAYVPLDPAYPSERLDFMLGSINVTVLLTKDRYLDVLAPSQASVIRLDLDWPSISSESRDNLGGMADPDRLAYVIYTSGSSGRPKGVAITHRNLAHSTLARFAYYRAPLERFLLLSSFGFDSSIAGIFWTLCKGATLVLPEPGLEREVPQLAAMIAEHNVSHMLCLPSLYSLLLSHAAGRQFASLRTVIVAGEPFAKDLISRHAQELPGADLFNEYGPTEATVWSSVFACAGQAGHVQVPIGRPIANAQIYILDDVLEPVPVGVTGEMYLGGGGIARGYLNQPELTAERFMPDHFSQAPGARLYKTGDLARFLPDGDINFIGRNDQQVKIRGFRIELSEIESVLNSHNSVREATVIARTGATGDKRLVAYLVSDDEDTFDAEEVRGYLTRKLPDYMVPSAFVSLEAMPMSPNGKLDRRALPAPEAVKTERREGRVTPRTPVEELIAG